MNLASLMWNIWKNNQNEGLQKIGPIICIVENDTPFLSPVSVWAWAGYVHSPNLKKAADMQPDPNQRKIIVSRSHAGPVEAVAKKSFGDNTEVIPAGGAGEHAVSSDRAYQCLTLIVRVRAVLESAWESLGFEHLFPLCACVFAMFCTEMLIFVCFVHLYNIDLYNYGCLCFACFSLSCKALWDTESTL